MISPKSSTVVSGVAYRWPAWFEAMVDDFGEIIHTGPVWLIVGKRGLERWWMISEKSSTLVRCGLSLAGVVWSDGG